MTAASWSGVALAPDVPRHGTTAGYGYWRCRCDACRASATLRARTYHPLKRAPRRFVALTLSCDTCEFVCDLATQMHTHCREVHGRRLSDVERTPRLVWR